MADEHTKSREEAVARAICAAIIKASRADWTDEQCAAHVERTWGVYLPEALAAITAYERYYRPFLAPADLPKDLDLQGPNGITRIKASHELSAGLDAEIQKEIDTTPAPIMRDEG